MKQISLWTLIPIAAVLVCGCSKTNNPRAKEEPISGKPTDPPVTFALQWKLGQHYGYYLETTQTTSWQRRQGEGHQQEITFAQDYSIEVTNRLRNGIRQMGLKIQSVSLDVGDEKGYSFNFDSENKALPSGGDPISTALKELVNGRMGIDLSANNKVIKVHGAQELLQAALEQKGASRAEGILRRALDQTTLRQMIELTRLPDKPLKVGESCQVKYDFGGAGVPYRQVEATYTFKGWQWHEMHKCALLEFSAKTGPQEDPKEIERDRRRSFKLENGTVEGKIWFDPQLGAVVDMVLDQQATVTYESQKSKEPARAPLRRHLCVTLVESFELPSSQWTEEPRKEPVRREKPIRPERAQQKSTNTVASARKVATKTTNTVSRAASKVAKPSSERNSGTKPVKPLNAPITRPATSNTPPAGI